MKRSHILIVGIIAIFALVGIPNIQFVPPSSTTDTVFLNVSIGDEAEARRSSFSSSRSSSTRSSSSSWGGSSSRKSSSSGSSWGWGKKSTPAPKPVAKPAPKKSSFSSAAPKKYGTSGAGTSKPGYTNSATVSKPAPKTYSNSSGVTAPKTSTAAKPAGKKSALSTAATSANRSSASANALKKYQAPKAGKEGFKSSSGATFKPQHTGSNYNKNYSGVTVVNRPVWVGSSPYPGMWTTLIALETMNAIERERYMMMLRTDPRYMAFYNNALMDPNLSPALRAQLMATNNMAYAAHGRPVGSSSGFLTAFLIVLTLCIVGGVVIAATRRG